MLIVFNHWTTREVPGVWLFFFQLGAAGEIMTWQLKWEKPGLGDEWPCKGQGSYFGPQWGWGVSGWGEGGTLLFLSKPGRLFFTRPPEGVLICTRPRTASHSVLRYLFSRSVMSDSVRPHGLQHTRPLCPSPSPEVCPSSCPLHQWCHPAISSSDALFSFCPQSFPASGTFPMSTRRFPLL